MNYQEEEALQIELQRAEEAYDRAAKDAEGLRLELESVAHELVLSQRREVALREGLEQLREADSVAVQLHVDNTLRRADAVGTEMKKDE